MANPQQAECKLIWCGDCELGYLTISADPFIANRFYYTIKNAFGDDIGHVDVNIVNLQPAVFSEHIYTAVTEDYYGRELASRNFHNQTLH